MKIKQHTKSFTITNLKDFKRRIIDKFDMNSFNLNFKDVMSILASTFLIEIQQFFSSRLYFVDVEKYLA